MNAKTYKHRQYPFSSYSWEVISESIAVKQMDKSAFLHHGTGVPKEIASFFDLKETDTLENKPILLKVNGKSFNAHIQMDAVQERFRLFWVVPKGFQCIYSPLDNAFSQIDLYVK